MKRASKRTLAIILALIMVFGGAPLGELMGLTDWLGGLNMEASAVHTWQVGDIGTFGSYPQTRVTYKTLLTALNAQTLDWVSYGYYSGTDNYGTMTQSDYMKYADVTYGGSKYRAVKFTSYRPYWTCFTPSTSATYQDENGYSTNTTYWFKYEPLRWRVLDPSTGLVMCETLIDSQAYSNTIYWKDIDGDGSRDSNEYFNNSAKTVYANDYATSSIRTWLNGLFLQTAFTGSEQSAITTTTLDNSAWPGYSQYNSASTNDKLFLLSYSDCFNTAYGFYSIIFDNDTARRAQGSDYAKCQGLKVYNSEGGYSGNSIWYLRSPGYESHYASVISVDGSVSHNYVYYTYSGVRPAFRISNLSYLTFTSSEVVPVTDISLSAERLSLSAGEIAPLAATVDPADATDASVAWMSSDESVATVSQSGYVTAIAPGTATITATANDKTNGTISDTCLVTVTPAHTWQVGDIGTFGSYPQTRVTDATLLSALNFQTLTWVSYGYYSGTGNNGSMTQSNYMKYADVTYGGAKYRAVKFTSYRPYNTDDTSDTSSIYYTYQDDNGYSTNTTYWFKYEPLRWRMLDPSSGLVLCETLIDSQAYSNTIYWKDIDGDGSRDSNEYFNNSAKTVYANDYATSSIRTWLNGLFLQTAFTGTEQSAITTTTLDNSARPGYSQYNSASTNDKMFLLSYSESINTSYGFSSNGSSLDTARGAKGSDYAKCQGLCKSFAGGEFIGNIEWYLRSSGKSSTSASIVSDTGYVSDSRVNITYTGVRPAFKISNLSYLIFTSSESVPVTSVSLSAESLTLTVSETAPLAATVEPAEATDASVAWTSSDENVAMVSPKGIVTAVAVGTTTITVTTNDGGFTDTCEVTVTAPTLIKIEIKTLPTKTSYFIGGTLDMTGLTLSATYSNNTTLTILSGFVCSPTTLNTVGTQILTVTYEGKSCTFYVDVNKIDASGFTVTAIPNQTYTGSAIAPTFEVKFNGETLVLNTDYTVSYSSNINAGTATVTITGKGNFEGTTTEPFNIIPANASDFTVMAIPDQTYTGSAITPTVVVNFNGTTLVLDTDYTVSYTSNINAGTATVTITGKGNFEGTTTEPFNIVSSHVAVTGITLSSTALSLQYKSTGSLTVTFNPANATNKNVTWTSSNEKVAIVDANGNVTAKGRGTATINATAEDGGYAANCTVTVKLVWWQWLIKILLFGWIWY